MLLACCGCWVVGVVVVGVCVGSPCHTRRCSSISPCKRLWLPVSALVVGGRPRGRLQHGCSARKPMGFILDNRGEHA